jgi:hypothetical protein
VVIVMFAEHGQPDGSGGRRGQGSGRGFGRRGGWQQADLPSADDASAWLIGRLPADWFEGAPTVRVDREEIVVLGALADPADPALTGDEAAKAAARAGRVSRFRESTRDARIAIAGEAEARYQRKLSWGVIAGGEELMFTHLASPVMTRLRQPDRQVLDTLVDAGVARSRADALSWCVRLVGQHADEWLGGLRDAMAEVDKLRQAGPAL